MTISELAIRRPVFATVLSLLLLILGMMAALRLSVREYPNVTSPVVNIGVTYRGANAAVVETRIPAGEPTARLAQAVRRCGRGDPRAYPRTGSGEGAREGALIASKMSAATIPGGTADPQNGRWAVHILKLKGIASVMAALYG